MTDKVYKRTNTARNLTYQDRLLSNFVPNWPTPPVFFDWEFSQMLRPSTRQGKANIYTASIALVTDDESGLRETVDMLNARKANLHCAEEQQVWKAPIPYQPFLVAWKDARKRGAAKRGAEISASTKKARTAAALALIEDDLKKDDYTTRELLGRVGVKSVNSIKNHYGITREQMQARYQAELKRKQRREDYAKR